MDTETKKRTRAKAEYLVEIMNMTGPGWLSVPDAGPSFSTSAKAKAWVKKSGESGGIYRVVRVVAGPVSVTIKTVEKRTLT